ncbi:MAG: Endoribonuclease Nob1 [Methanoregula sp. PtaU1.Bin051]|nr:MAG: Endoribonuclease Nob1 [Methanoregula sp. PtaU1.Bin051]
MTLVLDTSVFFIDYPLSGDLVTPPSVVTELADLRSKCRFESLLANGLQVRLPGSNSLVKVQEAARHVGDADRLSQTDSDVLALALDVNGTILSDDYAIHNVAHELNILVRPLQQRPAKRRVWKFRCTGCGRYSKETGECPVCGSQIKRTIK